MLVKELKKLLANHSDCIEVMIDNDGCILNISRTAILSNIDQHNCVIAEKYLDNSFNEKESVLILSTY